MNIIQLLLIVASVAFSDASYTLDKTSTAISYLGGGDGHIQYEGLSGGLGLNILSPRKSGPSGSGSDDSGSDDSGSDSNSSSPGFGNVSSHPK